MGVSLNHTKHLWLIPMNEDCKEPQRHLTQDELARSKRFVFPQDRKKFQFFRSVLRIILSQYSRVNPKDLEFEYNQYGKPSLKESGDTCVEFNLSHSAELAVCAVTQKRKIGVDTEWIREEIDIHSVADLFCSENEKKQLACRPSQERMNHFYALWTGKEAYGKAIGCGISFPLHEVLIPHCGQSFTGFDGQKWTIEHLCYTLCAKRYAISCVYRGEPSSTQFFLYKNYRNNQIEYEPICF